MDHTELNEELATAARLCEGPVSRVVLLIRGTHYEIQNVIPMGPTIILEAGEEVEAPVDPLTVEGIDPAERLERQLDQMERDDPAHLRIAEDQPAQDRPEDPGPLGLGPRVW